MARSKTSKDLSASILAGSEEMFDFFCQPCSSEQHLEAAGYCQDCSQYLCITCIKYHGKLAVSAHHTVLDKSAMPKTKIQQTIKSTDIITMKCRQHADKTLEYFCKTHDQICCGVCITLDHSSCPDKSYIPDISGGIVNSQEYQGLNAEIDRLLMEITQRLERINDGTKNNEKNHAKTLVDIKDFRKQINELLDKIEEDTELKIAKFHDRNVRNITAASEKLQSLLCEVSSVAANMDASEKAGQNNQLFVQIRLFSNRIANVERQMNEAAEYKIQRYAFYQKEKIQQMMSTLSAIWSLSVRKDDTPTKAHYVREVKVKADDDTEEANITGVTVLANDRVVVTDWDNKNVKLIEMKANKVVSRLSLSSAPFGVTELNTNQVAVALGNRKKIGILRVSDALSMSCTITTPDAVIVGLRHNGSNFITVCQHPLSVKIIDMSGSTLTTFRIDNNAEQLFTLPRYIALSRDKDVVYITDKEANTLTSMTLRGQVISVYKHDKLKEPRGVAVGKDGAVYVCSRDAHMVHQLTPTGDLTRIILGRHQDLAAGPHAIVYNDEDDSLYISSMNSAPELRNYIRIYQLK